MNACVAHGPGRGGALPRWHRGCDVANEKKNLQIFPQTAQKREAGGGGEACLLQPAFNHFYRRVARAPTRARQHKEKEEEAA